MTRAVVLLDTGPLVAALSRNDDAHAWAKSQFAALPAPFLTCESVISEACFLLRRNKGGVRGVLALIESGAVRLGMSLAEEALAVASYLTATMTSRHRWRTSVSSGWLRFTIVAWCFPWIPISISTVATDARLFPCRGRHLFSAKNHGGTGRQYIRTPIEDGELGTEAQSPAR